MHDTMPTATGVPIIGHLKDGRPVYAIAGGSSMATEGGQGGAAQGDGGASDGGADAGAGGSTGQGEGQGGSDGGAGGGSGDGGQTAATGQQGDGGAGQAQGQGTEGDISKLPAFAQKIIRDLRGENASHRTKARDAEGKVTEAETKHKATLDAIAKAAGLKEEDGPPDPAKLAAQLEQAQGTTEAARLAEASARIELQVYRTAQRLGADAERLLDSRSFCDTIDALDPKDDADFATQVEAKIGEYLEAHPTLRADQPQPKPPKPRSGGDIPGGPGGSGPITEDALRKMTPDQIAKAYAEGRLKHLM